MGKTLRNQILLYETLVTHIDKGVALRGYKDVPETVRDELYLENQEGQETGERRVKGSSCY
jgi:hypothetical protein